MRRRSIITFLVLALIGGLFLTSPSSRESRVALVIGNAAYRGTPLRNPVNDATDMAGALRELGFTVIAVTDAGQRKMEEAIEEFRRKLMNTEVGLFYYSGHGCQLDGQNYLIPIGENIRSATDIKYKCVHVGQVLGKMEEADNRVNIVIMDACRDNPFRGFKSIHRGLSIVEASRGTVIAYATSPCSVAEDGTGRNGTYTKHLLKNIKSEGIPVERTFKEVARGVESETDRKQTPWISSSLTGDFYFKPSSSRPPSPRPPAVPEPSPRAGEIWREPKTGMEFVWVPGGCYKMGSPPGERWRKDNEGPVQEVYVDGFWMGKSEVTNGQYRMYRSNHNSGDYEDQDLNGREQPVVHVSWGDARAYAEWLTVQGGGGYTFRLPTEKEWEYACRAGTITAWFWGASPDDACRHANLDFETSKKKVVNIYLTNKDCLDKYSVTASVGSFRPNRFGLYDMLGNVWEWCEDIYSADANSKQTNPLYKIYLKFGSRRVIRGGSWDDTPGCVRCALRNHSSPSSMDSNLGFRLMRTP